MTFCRLKKGKYNFPSPPSPCNLVVLFELPVGNNKHPTSNEGDGGGVWIVLFFDVTPFEVSVSLSP